MDGRVGFCLLDWIGLVWIEARRRWHRVLRTDKYTLLRALFWKVLGGLRRLWIREDRKWKEGMNVMQEILGYSVYNM
jgi:hypothetical protein